MQRRASAVARVILLIIIPVVFGWWTRASAEEGVAPVNVCTLTANVRDRPGAGNGPTSVEVGIYVIDVMAIDDVEQSFKLDFVIDVAWHDPRLATGSECVYGFDVVWHPMLTIFNQRKYDIDLPDEVTVSPDGMVRFTQRVFGHLASRLDLRQFPLDVQQLTIMLTSYLEIDEIALTVNQGRTGADPDFSIAGWAVDNFQAKVASYELAISPDGKPSVLPMATFSFQARRDVRFYTWKVVLPLIIIVLMSWAVFWINPKDLGPSLGVSTTSILTVIAFLFSLRGILPPVSYLTRMDYFVYSALGMVFLAHLEGLIKSALATKGHDVLAVRIQLGARIVMPILFLTVLTMFLFW